MCLNRKRAGLPRLDLMGNRSLLALAIASSIGGTALGLRDVASAMDIGKPYNEEDQERFAKVRKYLEDKRGVPIKTENPMGQSIGPFSMYDPLNQDIYVDKEFIPAAVAAHEAGHADNFEDASTSDIIRRVVRSPGGELAVKLFGKRKENTAKVSGIFSGGLKKIILPLVGAAGVGYGVMPTVSGTANLLEEKDASDSVFDTMDAAGVPMQEHEGQALDKALSSYGNAQVGNVMSGLFLSALLLKLSGHAGTKIKLPFR